MTSELEREHVADETYVFGWQVRPAKLSDESEVFDVVGHTAGGAVVTIRCWKRQTAEGLVRTLNGMDVVRATVGVD